MVTFPAVWQSWLSQATDFLVSSHGLDNAFAKEVAGLLAYLQVEGLQPKITSGFRDPAHQKELRDRWDRGDRAGLRVRPAVDSLHSTTGWLGKPASKAIDITTTNDIRAAQIARALGVGTGMDFNPVDRGHFYAKG